MEEDIFSDELIEKRPKEQRERFLRWISKICFLTVVLSFFFGIGGGFLVFYLQKEGFLPEIVQKEIQPITQKEIQPIIKEETIVQNKYIPQTTEEEKIINAVKKVSPAVVSIIITKDVPVFEKYYINPFGEGWPFEIEIPQYRQKGTERQRIGGGTGFIISKDGMVLTNKHVVAEKDADYTIFTSDGEKYPAEILAKDPILDLAILKIDQSNISADKRKTFPTVKLGDSSKLQIGQTVIAIGYALGEFQNTVSVGVVSGLGRTITASGAGMIKILEDVIQTDAAINPGNSGGPLLNLAGEVIGINVAKAFSGENIGFAIPINRAKKAIEQVKKTGRIIYPFLGIYYTLITDELKEKFNLPVNYGAWIGRDSQGNKTEKAVIPRTPAEKAGLKRDDIILEFGGEKITPKNSLSKVILKYNPGDEVTLKVLRGKEVKMFKVILGERK
ncbi:MAG: trypsin-like peptidase domain-containing protein [Candidatus Pacebacteria bacterium]|nr:trypsin-like peptidase domain-containing protein [Candidatus Paceibacterota bacterium]